ncbi:MAG: hypothetical protein IGS49_24870 [Chlorogloeopsis fritschii C42_A2020_084]|uniref:hypothetical protein n=1 Tax=Chlorogloeopsis fritschii TaxID=1124 RepID=UPI001A0F5ABA|nr:hypothetical protein [Chlorogloeopsis fritschii]MBF2008588.1 hypothetical protein [Chlorogloeopsis fritschii C42_A2020_084]
MVEQNQSSQLVLEPEQYKMLAKLAKKQGRTINDVVREVVRLGLESLELRKQRRKEALERLEQTRQEIYRTQGMYQGDPIAEVRAEREKQIDRVLRGEA